MSSTASRPPLKALASPSNERTKKNAPRAEGPPDRGSSLYRLDFGSLWSEEAENSFLLCARLRGDVEEGGSAFCLKKKKEKTETFYHLPPVFQIFFVIPSILPPLLPSPSSLPSSPPSFSSLLLRFSLAIRLVCSSLRLAFARWPLSFVSSAVFSVLYTGSPEGSPSEENPPLYSYRIARKKPLSPLPSSLFFSV